MLFEHYFEHSLKWTNLVSQLLNLPSVKIKVLALLAKFYCMLFCRDNFHCWVLPRMGLFHQQFVKTIFGFGSMWQLKISHLVFWCFNCHKWTCFQHAPKSMDARRKTLNCTKATWNAFYTCGSLAVSRSQSEFLMKRHSVQRSGDENCLHVLSFPKDHV